MSTTNEDLSLSVIRAQAGPPASLPARVMDRVRRFRLVEPGTRDWETKDEREPKPELPPGVNKIKLLLNPIAGKGIMKKTLRLLGKLMKERNPDIEVNFFLSGQQGDIRRAAIEAVEEGYQMVVAGGGDGTINEVVNALAGTDTVLGILPLGCGNVLAQELGIPKNIIRACDALFFGEVVTVDLGRANNRFFIWNAGMGVDSQVATEITPDIRDRWGNMAYGWFAFRHWKGVVSPEIRLVADGREMAEKGIMFSVGNAVTYWDKMAMNSRESISNGMLNVSILRGFGLRWALKLIGRSLMGNRKYYVDSRNADVVRFQCKRLYAEAAPDVFVVIDGELIGNTPMEFSVAPRAMKLILPRIKNLE